MTGPAGFRADLQVLHASLTENHGAVFADDSLNRLITTVDVFGFHMATVDLRQNSDVHERVVADLLKVAGRLRRLSGAGRGGPAGPAGRRAGIRPPAVLSLCGL